MLEESSSSSSSSKKLHEENVGTSILEVSYDRTAIMYKGSSKESSFKKIFEEVSPEEFLKNHHREDCLKNHYMYSSF